MRAITKEGRARGANFNISPTRVDVHGVASEEEAIQFIDDIKFIVEGAFVD